MTRRERITMYRFLGEVADFITFAAVLVIIYLILAIFGVPS